MIVQTKERHHKTAGSSMRCKERTCCDLKHAATDTFIRWLPYDFSQPSNRPDMVYSVLASDVTYSSVSTITPVHDFQLLPNPSSDFAYLRLNTGKTLYINATLLDIHGRLIAPVYSGIVGNSLIPIDTRTFASGLYFVVVNTGDSIQTLKLLKL